MIKLTFLSSLILFFTLILSGCNSEEDKLRSQLKKLEVQYKNISKENQYLITENLKLKQTAQYHFNQGVEILKSAKFVSDYESAKDHFNNVIVKFPNSDLVSEANKFVELIDNNVQRANLVHSIKQDLGKLLTDGKFKQAKSLLNKNKEEILEEDFNKLHKSIKASEDKPLVTTINRLVSNFAMLRNSKTETVLDMDKIRVKLNVRVVDIDRNRLAINVYGEKTYGEERIEVFYKNSNMVDTFTEKKADRYDIYEVTGTVKLYSNYESFYVDGESIKYLRHNKNL